MQRPTGERLRKWHRLCSASDYRRVFRSGLRLDGPLFLMVAVENDCGYDRLGLAASRRIGGATARNRAKRVLRESFRRSRRDNAPSFDLVLVAKPEIVLPSQREVEREYRERLRRLSSRRGARARRADPAARD